MSKRCSFLRGIGGKVVLLRDKRALYRTWTKEPMFRV